MTNLENEVEGLPIQVSQGQCEGGIERAVYWHRGMVRRQAKGEEQVERAVRVEVRFAGMKIAVCDAIRALSARLENW